MTTDIKHYYQLIAWTLLNQKLQRDRLVDYLEIGTQEGGSLNAAMDSGAVGLAIAIDTWGGEYGGTKRGGPHHVIDRLGESKMRRVVLVTGDSAKAVPTISHQFDVIFIDGDHSESGCGRDMENCWPLLCSGGVMLVDDTDHPEHSHIRRVTADFAARNGAGIVFHPLQHGVAEIRKPQ